MATCKICSQELIIELDPEDFDEATSSAAGGAPSSVPDDLLLTCGCHFHWQCLLDESPKIATDGACPSCSRAISTSGQILTKYHNEGGVQDNLDIASLIKEEAYLEANPAARPARAYITSKFFVKTETLGAVPAIPASYKRLRFLIHKKYADSILSVCAEGDVVGIVELLQAIEEDSDDGDMSPAEILRYQDPLDGMKTGLHIAIEKSQQEAAWALLWLASDIPTSAFPEEVTRDAQVMSSGRQTTQGPDIRGLRTSSGKSAADLAEGMGGTWAALLGAGFLRV